MGNSKWEALRKRLQEELASLKAQTTGFTYESERDVVHHGRESAIEAVVEWMDEQDAKEADNTGAAR
jgi:hypothetical protein